MLDVVTTLPSTLPQCHRLQAVPIANIVGSVNRSSDFDKDFYPCNDVLENRWVRVASMILQGMSMPPVELIQVGNSYYVVDGHHRVSVLHMLKMDIVDAIITAEYNTDISNG